MAFSLPLFLGFFAGDVVRFLGNQSAVDNFRLMERDGNFLLVGATWVYSLIITRLFQKTCQHWSKDCPYFAVNVFIFIYRNVVFFLDTKDLSEIKDLVSLIEKTFIFFFFYMSLFCLFQSIVWHPDSDAYEMCLLKGKTQVRYSLSWQNGVLIRTDLLFLRFQKTFLQLFEAIFSKITTKRGGLNHRSFLPLFVLFSVIWIGKL